MSDHMPMSISEHGQFLDIGLGVIETRQRHSEQSNWQSWGELGGEQFYEAAATKLGEIDAVVGADVTAATALAIDLKGTEDIDVVVEVAGLEAQDNLITASLGHDELHSLPLWND